MGSWFSTPRSDISNFHELKARDGDGNEIDFATLKGKVVLVSNVACKCGLTSRNYKEFKTLQDKYRDEGLEIMLFPCNQFANQEPGTPEEIKEFVTARDVDAMLMEKVKVNGKDSSPVFQYLKVASRDTGPCTWNFKCKFLVRKDGTVEGRYGGYPLELEPKIKELLQQ